MLRVPVTVESAQPLKLTIKPQRMQLDRSFAAYLAFFILGLWISVQAFGSYLGWFFFLSVAFFGISRSLYYREAIEFDNDQFVLRRLIGNFELNSARRKYIDIELIEWFLKSDFFEFGPRHIEIHSKGQKSIRFASGQSKKDLHFIRQHFKEIQPTILPKLAWNGIMKLDRIVEQRDCPDSGAHAV